MFNKFDDNYELFRLSLQFFGDGDGEPEEPEDDGVTGEGGAGAGEGSTSSVDPPKYVSDGSGGQKSKEEILKENGFSSSQEEYENKAGALGEQDFYDKYGLDPDRDYLSQKKEHEYNYMTEMATYGEKAERLYQLGLSNSGVSDIFQANAYSAYLSNVNTAAAERIEAKRKNALAFQEYRQGITADWLEEERLGNQAYSQYEDKYNTQLNSDTGNAFNAALQSGLFTGEYTADGLTSLDYDKVSIYLQNMGYSSVVIEKVWEMLNKMDRQSVIDQRSLSAYKLLEPYLATWDPSDEDTMANLRDYLKKQGYTDTNIQAAFDMANSYATATQPGSVIVGAVGPDGKAVTITPGENGTYTDANGNPITKNENGTYTDAEGNVVGYDMLEGEQARADQYLLNEISLEGKTLEQITAAINAGDWSLGAKQYLIAKATEKYNKLPENTTVTVGPDGKAVTITPGENGTYTDANGNPITKNENGTYTDAEGNVVGYDMSQKERASITEWIYQTDYQLFESIEELEAYIENFDLSPGAEQFAKDFATSKWNAENGAAQPTMVFLDKDGNRVEGGSGSEGVYEMTEEEAKAVDNEIRGLNFHDMSLADFIADVDDSDYGDGAKQWLKDQAEAKWAAFPAEFAKELWLNIKGSYTGNEFDKNDIRDTYSGYGFDDEQWSEIFSFFDQKIKNQVEANDTDAVNDIGKNLEDNTLTADDLNGTSTEIGSDTGKAELQVTGEAAYDKYFGDMDSAYTFLNIDKATWDAMDSGEKTINLMYAAADSCAAGAISSKYFNGLVDKWMTENLEGVEEEEPSAITGGVISMIRHLKEWKAAADIQINTYLNILSENSSVREALESSICFGQQTRIYPTDEMEEMLQSTLPLLGGEGHINRIVYIGGKLYRGVGSYDGIKWYELGENSIKIKKGPFNSTAAPEIYEMLLVAPMYSASAGSGYYNGNPSQDELQKEVTGELNMNNVDAGDGGDTNSGAGRGSVTGGGIGKGTLNGSQDNK